MTLFEVKVQGRGHSAQFQVEPCSEKMSARDVRDALKVIVNDMAGILIRDGVAPVIDVSEATRRRTYDK